MVGGLKLVRSWCEEPCFHPRLCRIIKKKDARPGWPCHIGGHSGDRGCDCPLVDVAEAGAGRRGDEQAEDLACVHRAGARRSFTHYVPLKTPKSQLH